MTQNEKKETKKYIMNRDHKKQKMEKIEDSTINPEDVLGLLDQLSLTPEKEEVTNASDLNTLPKNCAENVLRELDEIIPPPPKFHSILPKDVDPKASVTYGDLLIFEKGILSMMKRMSQDFEKDFEEKKEKESNQQNAPRTEVDSSEVEEKEDKQMKIKKQHSKRKSHDRKERRDRHHHHKSSTDFEAIDLTPELTFEIVNNAGDFCVGIVPEYDEFPRSSRFVGATDFGVSADFHWNALVAKGTNQTDFPIRSSNSGDVIVCEVDMTTRDSSMWFFKDGVAEDSVVTDLPDSLRFAFSLRNNGDSIRIIELRQYSTPLHGDIPERTYHYQS
eukprot:MONOS_100.1-p1 / transcript=MONOS_100.1 / gene=MONOS_100 / organism=Monocercomonoides_exilis_PA203 / gene_product=unspecified product / transcript_product=unspecified product / location=Mono_scaffold00002:73296-75396(-) / protein_length=332 / sequence_SO=supercontig / SO=protein_coding / is_pseudo=false